MMMMAHNEFLSFRSPVQMGLQDVTVEMREFKRAHERWTQQILAAMAIPDFASMAKIDKQKELEALDTFDYWIKTLRSVGQRVPKELLELKSTYPELIVCAEQLLSEKDATKRKELFETFTGNPFIETGGMCGAFSNILEMGLNKVERWLNTLHPTTKIPNKMAWLSDIEETNLNQCSLLVFDLDNFKKINDNHGHDVGDKVLVTVSDAITTHLREEDKGRLYHFGGDEMVAIVQANRDELAPMIERLQENVALATKTLFEKEGIGLDGVTVSIGGAPIPTIAGKSRIEKAEMAFKAADTALLEAKKHPGKGRGVVPDVSYPHSLTTDPAQKRRKTDKNGVEVTAGGGLERSEIGGRS